MQVNLVWFRCEVRCVAATSRKIFWKEHNKKLTYYFSQSQVIQASPFMQAHLFAMTRPVAPQTSGKDGQAKGEGKE